jgi:competence protein ComEC
MTSPWTLVAAGGVTVGALFDLPGVLVWTIGVAIAALPGGRRWAPLAVVAAIAAGIGMARVATDAPREVVPPVLTSVKAEAVVRSQPQAGPSGPRAVVRVERVAGDDMAWIAAEGDVLVLFREHAPDDLAKGDRIQVRWAVTGLDSHETGFGRFVRASGAGASASAFSVMVISRGDSPTGVLVRLRDRVTDQILAAVPGDAGALLAGFVTGDDSGLSDATREAFDRTNMSHITAVSGSNVAVLVTMWLVLAPTQRLRRSLPALAGIALAIWQYVMLVGMGPGAVRAGLFATILLPAARLGRKPDPLTALMLASAVMLLVRPGFAHNLGFWLSLAASTAMVTCLIQRQRSRVGIILSGMTALVAAQVATLPVTVWAFGGWSPGSLVANLVVGPVVAVFFPFAFGFALFVTVLPWLGDLVGWLPAIVADVIIAIVRSVAAEFAPMRTTAMPPAGIGLIAVLALAVIGAMSGDVRRWLRRVEWSVPPAGASGVPIAIGLAAGVWLGTVAYVLIR